MWSLQGTQADDAILPPLDAILQTFASLLAGQLPRFSASGDRRVLPTSAARKNQKRCSIYLCV
jgi:hypothetical protein